MKQVLVALLGVVLAGSVVAQDIAKRPYLFTQGHNGQAQTIDASRNIQVQLPSNSGKDGTDPVSWSFLSKGSQGIQPLGEARIVSSPGRIEDLDQVTVFEFAYTSGPEMLIVLQANRGAPPMPDRVYALILSPE